MTVSKGNDVIAVHSIGIVGVMAIDNAGAFWTVKLSGRSDRRAQSLARLQEATIETMSQTF